MQLTFYALEIEKCMEGEAYTLYSSSKPENVLRKLQLSTLSHAADTSHACHYTQPILTSAQLQVG